MSALVKSKIKTRVLELTDACRAVDKTPAISRFVYRGDDLARKWKSALRPDDPGALAFVTDACKRITAGLSASVRPEFTNFSAEVESEGVWLVWEVRFEGNGTVVREAFAFLEVDGDYLLGDVD